MRTCLVVALLTLIIGCSGRDEEQGRSDGGKTAPREISGKTADDLLMVSRIIDLETSPESLIAFPFDLCVSEGEVFVASRNNEIKVFDLDGHYRRSIGRLGDGPGEYRAIGSLFPRGCGEIGVYDWSNLRLTVFSRNGEYRTSAVLGMPGMEGVRSVLFIDGCYYIHVPSSPAQNVHIVKTDTAMAVVGAFVEADRRYTGYQDRYLFNGGIVMDTARKCIYEADSYFYGIRRVDPATGTVTELEFERPSFYVSLPVLPMPTSMEEALAHFQKGTNVYNLFRVAGHYLMLEYHTALGQGRVKVNYLLYDLDTGTCFTVPAGEAHPCYADGEHLYTLLYHSKNSTEHEEEMVKNPSLVIYDASLENL